MSRLQQAGGGRGAAAPGRLASQAEVLQAHRRSGRHFEAAGVRSFVREQGNRPAVLCIHGMIGSSFLYRKVLAELAARGLRLMLDVGVVRERRAGRKRYYSLSRDRLRDG